MRVHTVFFSGPLGGEFPPQTNYKFHFFGGHFAEEPGILKEALPFQNMAQLCLHLHCTSLGFNAEYAAQKYDRNLTRPSPPV